MDAGSIPATGRIEVGSPLMDENPATPEPYPRVLAVYRTLTEKGLRIWDLIAKSEASTLESLLVQAQPR